MVVDAVVTRVIDHIVGHAVGVYGAVASVVLQDARSVHFVTLFDRVNMSCTFCVFCRRKSNILFYKNPTVSRGASGFTHL